MPSIRAERRQAVREDRLKLKLERTFRNELRSIFGRMVNDFKINILYTGWPLGMAVFDIYKADWKSLLNRHYLRVHSAFKNMVRTEQTIKQEDDESNEDEVLGALLLWRQMQSERSAGTIMTTNERNMRDSLMEAQEELTREGKPLDSRSIAALAIVFLRRKFRRRTQIIAEYETQLAAEKSKLTQAESIAGVLGRGFPRVVIAVSKVWRTMRDERVRPNHRAAEGQVRPVNQPFDVGGQKLMYPGDWSLGATASNLMGCRCVSIYRI